VLRAAVCLAIVAMPCLLVGTPAFAHPVPFSYVDLRLQREVIDATLVVHVFDAAHDLNIAPAERLLDADTARHEADALAAMLASRFTVTADGRLLAPTWLGVEPIADRQSLRLRLTFPLSAPPGVVQVTARMFPYDPQHQTFVNVYDDGALSQGILDAGHDRFEYFAGTTQGRITVIRRLLPAGIEHILIGPDHVLFLIGLLLTGGTIRRLAFMVTAFTVAHSITLSLAALNILSPSARIIEPAIALSIVYVGADNLLVRNGHDLRVWIAFAFGFIHGFGFASVLREMELPRGALIWSLLSFNVGVEIGQVLIVVAVASVFAWLRARSEAAGRQLAFVGSIVVIAAGAFWFVQRVFVPGGIS
jgi:hydrogenase/urease accessory protein HupE